MGGGLTVGSFIERVLVLERSCSLAVHANVDAEFEHAASRVDITVESLTACWAISDPMHSLLRFLLGLLPIDPRLELSMLVRRSVDPLWFEGAEGAPL